MTLAYPEMRAELVDCLGQLSDPRLRRPQKEEPSPLDQAIHFLFDDTPLSDEPARALGYYLIDQEEVDAVSRVVRALDQLLEAHGIKQPDSFYIRQPEWKVVEATAAKAYELLGRWTP